MILKENLNKIHSNLSNIFSDIKILEKSELKYGNYIEFIIKEGKKELKVIIPKKELESKIFNWKYLSDPSDYKSIVERKSNLESFSNDLLDIFDNNRFNSKYLESIK